MPLTLDQIKDIIITNTKQLEICDTLHDAQNAATEDDLVKAGLPLVVYTYQSAIVDDDLLSEFNEVILNANGIYTTGSFTLTNPTDEVYILKNASVTVNLDGTTNQKINVMGAGNLVLVASDKSYATVKAYDDSTLNITINDEAMVSLETKENSVATITQNNSCVLHLISNGSSQVTHEGNDTAYGLAKMFQHSAIVYTLNGSAAMVVKAFNSATVNGVLT